MDLTIRQETVEDWPAVDEIVRRAFGREDEARFVRAARAAPEFIPELSLVAELDGSLAGHVLFLPIMIESDAAAHRALVLAPLAVRPDGQNAGVGSRLAREGLERGRAVGHRLVVVTGHPNYYPRFGFVPARPLGIEPPAPLPDPVFMVCELVEGALRGVRGKVRYPPAFEVLEPP